MLQRNKIKLGAIAGIRFGYHGKPVNKGAIAYLQTKHLDEKALLTEEMDSYLTPDTKNEGHLLQEGEIILAGKGNRNPAWVYRNATGPAVASSIFFVVSADESRVLPEYLCALFNTAATQAYFQTLGAGSSIPSIRKSELEAFELYLPPMATQQKVVVLQQLQLKEQQLTEQILAEKQKIYNSSIQQLIHSTHD